MSFPPPLPADDTRRTDEIISIPAMPSPSLVDPPETLQRTTLERSTFNGDGDLTSASHPLTSNPDQAETISQADEPGSSTKTQDETERVHFERVSAGEDAQQVIISTTLNSVYGRDVIVGARGSQLLGRMADSSVQQLSQDRAQVLLRTKEDATELRETVGFNRAYGIGRRLNED